MKITGGRYTLLLAFQIALIFIDWNINTFAQLPKESNAVLLILFIVQVLNLIIATSLLMFTFFSTYVFQTGLVYLLYERFRTTLMICMLYFVLTTSLHIWTLVTRWNNAKYSWGTAYFVLFILHRLTATVYYYSYKRACLRISDPRFYDDIDAEPDKQNIRALD